MLEPYWGTDYGYHHSHRQQFEYLGLDKLSDHLAFVHDSQLQIYQGLIEHDVELIRQCQQQSKRLPVLTLDSNPYHVEQYVQKLNQYLDPNSYFVFHSDIRQSHSCDQNVAPWPSWLLYQHFLPDDQANKPKIKRISFLSGVPRSHRIYLFRHIKPLITEQDVVVVNGFQRDFVDTPQSWLKDIPWSNSKDFFDTDPGASNAEKQAYNIHPAYEACVNVTGETLGTGDQVLPSEKTWKAYKSGCLVVNFGVNLMPDWLQSVGIEIWKDFDLSIDYQQKTKIIQQLFEQKNLFEIYYNNREMIEHNKNLVMSKNFAYGLASMAKEKLQCLIK